MRRNLDTSMEKNLVELVNTGAMKKGKGIELEKYQNVGIYIYDRNILNAVLKHFKFKDSGTVYDYDDYLQIPETVDGYMASLDSETFQRLAASKKINSVVYYTKDWYSINCMFLIDLKYLDKFLKKVGEFLRDDSVLNEFKDADLSYKPKSYLDILPAVKDETKEYDIVRKVIPDEGLVFDENSTIYAVKKEISSFFTQKTEDMYTKLKIPYKRGIILHGEPGNGKSAMIRELIRNGPDIPKIRLNSSINNIPYVLKSIIDALGGKKAMLFMEDLDSMVDEDNRSEFLNILDGSDINSGILIIGTTNYLEKLDSGFVERPGRFDSLHEITNPTEDTRRLFFASRHLYELFSEYKISNNTEQEVELVKLFVDNSANLPMASLKEIITSTAYKLLDDNTKTVEDAVIEVYKSKIDAKDKHEKDHQEYLDGMPEMGSMGTMIRRKKRSRR